MFNLFRTLCTAILIVLVLLAAPAMAELVTSSDYQLVSKTRVGRTAYEYTYQVIVSNDGEDAQAVTASVTSSSPNTTIVDSDVSFGDVAGGESVTSSDTFSFQQNRTYAFNPSDLTWSIQSEPVIPIISPDGGVLEGEDEITLIIPPGATETPVPVVFGMLPQDEIGSSVPPNTTFLGGVFIDMGETVLNDNIDISIPVPPGTPTDAEIYLAELVEYAGQNMFHLVDTAIIQDGSITSQDPAFPGVLVSGSYVFLQAQNVGWVEGHVSNANGYVQEAVVSLSGGYWVDIADSSGSYGLPAWAGNYVVVAFDPYTGDHGEKQGYISYSGASATTNVFIGTSTGPVNSTIENGNFETGDLTGWQISGSGDVVTSFGGIVPFEGNYMASISTGSSAVGGSSSSLEQTFTVPAGATELIIHYNFVSAEYPEWVGSSFNDVFNATLHTPDGSAEIAFESVNTAAFQDAPGLNSWGETGWSTATINVEQWAGTDDTLTFSVHDVGDTAVDTVVLVDDIGFGNEYLESGDIVSDSIGLNQWKYYAIKTASSDQQISFDLTHLSADIDLYVRQGAEPTLTEHDCRPFKTNNGDYFLSETCIQNNPGDDVWYIGVHGNEAGSYRLKTLIGSVEGWANTTTFKQADTVLRENIVNLAYAAIGSPSGLSQVCAEDRCWLTDIADGDGARMRNAISVYHDWRENHPNAVLDPNIRTSMIDQFNNSAYPLAQQNMLVNQIINLYDGTVPSTDNETLSYLNIQKQCLEWAMYIAGEAGGVPTNYGGSGPFTAENITIRPGMGYYDLDFHAMLIIDVYYNSHGEPQYVRVAESNWGTGWANPGGQVPWERTVRGNRDTVGANTHTAISYDNVQ